MRNTKLIVFHAIFWMTLLASAQNREVLKILERGTNESRIKILNFGTFHFGNTPDANKTEFDENNKKNRKLAHQLAKMLADFEPTVIVVEQPPENQESLEKEYHSYLENPEKELKNPREIQLIGFEVGRLAGVEKIYGIDHRMGYAYNINEQIENEIDSLTVNNFFEAYIKSRKVFEGLTFFEKFRTMNHNTFLDYLITINADFLSYVGTKENFEGADEAAKYYQRNLRMFSNLNRLGLQPDDKVFILMGASHTAFFRDFISRSPNYEMVDTFKYLKK